MNEPINKRHRGRGTVATKTNVCVIFAAVGECDDVDDMIPKTLSAYGGHTSQAHILPARVIPSWDSLKSAASSNSRGKSIESDCT